MRTEPSARRFRTVLTPGSLALTILAPPRVERHPLACWQRRAARVIEHHDDLACGVDLRALRLEAGR
jgi:hypothetical protein